MGEAINLVNNFKVEKVIFNCGEFNELEQELIKVLNKKKISYYSCIKELNIDNNKLYFLQTKEYDNENDNSNVIFTELNGYKFMFMGDASVTTEKIFMPKDNDFINDPEMRAMAISLREELAKEAQKRKNPYIGKDGKYYYDKESLDEANRMYNETRYTKIENQNFFNNNPDIIKKTRIII